MRSARYIIKVKYTNTYDDNHMSKLYCTVVTRTRGTADEPKLVWRREYRVKKSNKAVYFSNGQWERGSYFWFCLDYLSEQLTSFV